MNTHSAGAVYASTSAIHYMLSLISYYLLYVILSSVHKYYIDTKGPEIRTGKVDPSLGGKVKYTKGDIIEIGTDFTRPCTSTHLACSYKSLPTTVKVGSRILVADGSLALEVTEIGQNSDHVLARVLNNVSFGDNKNMNLPGAIVDLPTLTEKDIIDLQEFGVARNVDFIAASFVRKVEDILFIRKVLGTFSMIVYSMIIYGVVYDMHMTV